MPSVQETTRHSLSHTTKADETNIHETTRELR